MTDKWDNKKAKDQQRHADRLRGSNYGKGDKRRPENLSRYRLGMRLIQLVDEGKRDTQEYSDTLQLWRTA